MKRSDTISVLVLGEIIAIFLIFVLKNLGYFSNLLWLTLIILPLLALLAFFIAYFIGKKILVILQLAKFVVVGIANTAVDFGILNLLMLSANVVSGGLYSVFKGISFCAAVVHSYFWNKHWTFQKKQKEETGKEFLQFFVVSLIGLAINVSIASLIVNYISAPGAISAKIWANIGAAGGSIGGLTWNFLGYKFIVFKK